MHQSSYERMEKFAADYQPARVLDVGSRDINGTYGALFSEYVGFDVVPGGNVDVTSWDDIEHGTFDAVISGQTLEHTEDDTGLVQKMVDVLKPGGMCCIIVPSHGPKHCEPDYRRYTYQSWLEPFIDEIGAKTSSSQALMVRHLAISRLAAQVFALPAINGKHPEPTAPMMRLENYYNEHDRKKNY